jgi:hypothetical protein
MFFHPFEFAHPLEWFQKSPNEKSLGCTHPDVGNQLRDLEKRLALLYLYLIPPQAQEFAITLNGQVRNDYVNFGGTGSSFFLGKCSPDIQGTQTERNQQRANLPIASH